jgi:hypothetical protein
LRIRRLLSAVRGAENYRQSGGRKKNFQVLHRVSFAQFEILCLARILRSALLVQKLEIFAEVFDAGVEGDDGAVGAGLHYAAFHDGEDKFRKRLHVAAGGKAVMGGLQEFFDGGGPAIEIVSEAFVDSELFFGDFKREAADGTAVAAVGFEQIAAIKLQDAEDARDGIGKAIGNGVDDDGFEGLNVEFEDGEEEFLFGFEKVVEAAGVGVGTGENFGDAGGGVAAEPEEVEGGFDDALAGGGGHQLVE